METPSETTAANEWLVIYYQEACQRFRQLDSLAYQLLQFYVTIYGAVLAAQNVAMIHSRSLYLALTAVSVLFFLVMLRLRRNYWTYSRAAQEIEEQTGHPLSGPYSTAVKQLKRVSVATSLAAIPASYLYYLIFLVGTVASAALYQSGA